MVKVAANHVTLPDQESQSDIAPKQRNAGILTFFRVGGGEPIDRSGRITATLSRPIFRCGKRQCQASQFSTRSRRTRANSPTLAMTSGAQRMRLGYDQEVVRTDRSARGLELGTDATIFTSAGHRAEGCRAQPGWPRPTEKVRGAFTGATVAKRGRGDDADAKIVASDLDDLVEHRPCGFRTRSVTNLVASM